MTRRMVKARIVKNQAAVRFKDRSSDEGGAAYITSTNLSLGYDMSTLLDPCADTRDREIWGIDADVHRDDGETFSARFVNEFKLGGM